uniref:Calponin-homology (CH) domain-containing protein n=1 Tax=Mola mola TaxID=94237 RepID=A0A3Q4AL51_MOLML
MIFLATEVCFCPPPENCGPYFCTAVTGRCFGDKDFRRGLENGILLCELLSSIRPGLVKKINRLPTPIAGLVSSLPSLIFYFTA